MKQLIGAFLVIAIAGTAGTVFGADATISGSDDFKSVMEATGRSDGDVITIANGVDVKLGGLGYVNVARAVTLQGQAASALIATGVASAVTSLNNSMRGNAWRAALNGHSSFFANLVRTVTAAIPTTELIGSTGPDGVYFSRRSSLINLTIDGFDVNSTTGTTYRPHVTDSPIFLPPSDVGDGNGFEVWRNVAVVGNEITHNATFDGGVLGGRSNDDNTPETYAAKTVVGLLSMDNKITSVTGRVIGGALGAWGTYETVDQSLFINNFIKADRVSSGSAMAPDHIGTLSNSIFYGNESYSTGSTGRGPIYLYEMDWALTNPVYSITLMENTYFINNWAHGSTSMGGAISDRVTDGIGTIRNSVFAYNTASSDAGSAIGGAIDAGANPSDSSNGSGGGGINLIDGSVFYANKAETTGEGATHYAYGGAIALGGRENKQSALGKANFDNFTIRDSLFIGNLVITKGARASGGALFVGTNMATTSTEGYRTVNFTTSAGGLTEFSGNRANGSPDGISVGSMSGQASSFNVRFNVDPGANGTVLFADPITVLMNNANSPKAFEMNRIGGNGDFRWGGRNVFDAQGGSTLNFISGRTSLLSDFNLTRSLDYDLKVNFASGSELYLDLEGRSQNLAYFDDLTGLTATSAKITVSDDTIGDFTREYLLATGTGLSASGFAPNQTIEGNVADGLRSSVVVAMSGDNLVLRVSRTGTADVFRHAGPNAAHSQTALTRVFNGLSRAERDANYDAVFGNLASFTAEPLAGQVAASLDASAAVVSEMKGQFLRSLSYGAPSAGDGSNAYHVWGGFLFRKIDQEEHEGYSGYDSDIYGGVIGFMASLAQSFSIGAYVAAGSGSTDYNDIDSSIDSDFMQYGLVAALYPAPRVGITADLSVSKAKATSERHMPAYGTAKADYDVSVFSMGLEGSYSISLTENATLRPFLELRYQKLTQDEIRETGGGVFGMVVDEINHDEFFTKLGVEISHDIQFGSGAVVTPKGMVAWKHRFGGERLKADSHYVSRADLFPVEALLPQRDQAILGVGLDLQPAGKDGLVALSAGYQIGVGSSGQEHNAFLTLDFRF
ncbi:MAG: autotransporter outer membrane beta-barrel domain-containing protein [Deltaproteobacteria bacterium]|jgi:outer membrane autotransporter protein|nr:autotransporter outer membrane beta-barrel domain-containing protein [Deltaproteobacteria bacterium]